jgi:hypothetical protein
MNREELHCEVIVPGAETCRVCRSKSRTYEQFRGLLPVPAAFDAIEEIDRFPVFLKPDVGQGSKGTYLARSPEEVAFYRMKDPSLLILEYLPGREFTVDCFTDNSGRLLFAGARERTRILNGISVDTARVFDPQLEAMAQAINDRLDLRGAWFFQAKRRADGEAALLEIAPRVAGSMGYFRNLGVNLPLLAVLDRMGLPVSVLTADHELQMDRALVSRFRAGCSFESVYVDLDDTLLLGERVNTTLVAFLYQCLNEGKRVILLTKTRSPLEETLAKYRLRHLFDEIIHLEPAQEKHRFIRERDAIFIDDSFAERRAVVEALKIPAFDTCAVESLLDWRA